MKSKYAIIAIIFSEILIYFLTLKIENLPFYSSKTFGMTFQFVFILEKKNISDCIRDMFSNKLIKILMFQGSL